MAHSQPRPGGYPGPPEGPPGPRGPPLWRPRQVSASSACSGTSTSTAMSSVLIKQEPFDLEDLGVHTVRAEQHLDHLEHLEQQDGALPLVISGFEGNAHDLWSHFEVGSEDTLVQVKTDPDEEPRALLGRGRRSVSVEDWSEWEQRTKMDDELPTQKVHVKAEPSEVRVKEEERSDDDEVRKEARISHEENEVHVKEECMSDAEDEAHVKEEQISDEEDVNALVEQDGGDNQFVRPARPSTTLLPATKVSVHPEKLEEMKRQAAALLRKHAMERAKRDARRKQEAAAAGSEPRAPRAASMLTEKTKSSQVEAEAKPRRVSEARSSTDSEGGGGSGRRRRMAHQPPPGFLGEVGEPVERPKDPRLYRPQKQQQKQERILKPEAAPKKEHRPNKRSWDSLSQKQEQDQCGEGNPRERTPPRKKGLLQTPPSHMRLYPSKQDRDSMSHGILKDRCGEGNPWQRTDPPGNNKGLPKTPSDDETPPQKKPLLMNSIVKLPNETERGPENDHEFARAMERPSNKWHVLPVLPPATHIHTKQYDGRSPLEELLRSEGKEPKKYLSAKFQASSLRDRLLLTICRWKPEWITTSEVIAKDKFPDVLNNGEKYEKEQEDRLNFSSADEYCKHFHNGLFLDMWSNLCKTVLDARKKGPILTFAAVEGEAQEISLLGHIKRRTLSCHCGSDSNKFIQKNDIVIVNSKYQSYFAYVVAQPETKCISDKVKLSRSLSELCHGRTFIYKCSFLLMVVVVESDNSLEPTKSITIEKVRNINDDLETMISLDNFLSCNLSTLVLQPKYLPPINPALHLKYESVLYKEQKSVLCSLIQDIQGKEAPSMNVVEGGPGTGKSFLAAVLAKELANKKDYFVIVASQSNFELNILAKMLSNKLQHDGFIEKNPVRAVWCGNEQAAAGLSYLKKISLKKFEQINSPPSSVLSLTEQKQKLIKEIDKEETDIKILTAKGKSTEAKILSATCADKKINLSLVESKLKNQWSKPISRNISSSKLLEKCDVLLTTFSPTIYCLEAFKGMKRQCKRVALIVDNASEVVEPIIIRTIVTFKVTDVVLLGDIKQHVPFVPNKRARNSGLVVSLMERYSRALRDTEITPHRLTCQWRLHPDVFHIINREFYDSLMREPENIRNSSIKPYIWFNCSYFPQGDKRFQVEADFAEKLLKAVCVVKPYPYQEHTSKHIKITSLCANVSKILGSSSVSELFAPPKHLNSSEFDVIILCVGTATRERAAKMITPWTRAKRSLFVCGNFDHQPVKGPMLDLLKNAQSKGYLKEITNGKTSVEALAEKIKN